MSDLDTLLKTLGSRPTPAALLTIDDSVLAGMAARRDASVARRGMIMAGVVAAFVGIVGAVVPGAPASAEPLLGVPHGAPSHLLAD
jgi:hypothetical protein